MVSTSQRYERYSATVVIEGIILLGKHQVRLTDRVLLLSLIMFNNQFFEFEQMSRALFNLPAAIHISILKNVAKITKLNDLCK